MPIKAETMISAAAGFGHLPVVRQVGMFIGLALTVALAVAIVLWAKEPIYRPLFSNLNIEDVSEVSDALQKADIPYRLDEQTGTLLIPNTKIHKARMALAADGLPKNSSKGFANLEKGQKFGTSQFMENARYLHALEGELENTISSFDNVKQARVHIALPKQSVFVKNFRSPSASVLVDIYKSHTMREDQVSAIVHLVASSVPGLAKENVTVVDQSGNLLTNTQADDALSLADRQLKYIRAVESEYVRKVEDLLMPVLGPGKIRVRVAADIDFTQVESTQEEFDNQKPAIRSEQTMKENRADSSVSEGVPGALSNQSQPSQPQNPNLSAAEKEKIEKSQNQNTNQRSQETRNYEIDKTISHTRKQVGYVKRLSIAILADDYTKVDAKSGKVMRTALKPEELEQIKKLAQEAVGFSQERGDTVVVINRGFVEPPPIEQAAAKPIWERDWFLDVVKQVLGGLFVLYMVFGILRPMFRNLANRGVAVSDLIAAQESGHGENDNEQKAGQLANELAAHDEQMRLVREMATSDPKRVAQVVKRWMDSD